MTGVLVMVGLVLATLIIGTVVFAGLALMSMP